MTSKSAEPSYGSMEELHAALDGIPADDPRNYLRQSLQLLVPLLEQMQHHLDVLEARLAALESRGV
jgi:hypothetical protein